MDDLQKLRVLIPHWAEHNEEHAAEFHTWADRAAAAELIRQAAREMTQVNQTLQTALDGLGGAIEAEGHYH